MICCKWFLNRKAFQFVFWSEFTRCSLLLIFDMLGFHLWHIFLNAALLHMPPILVWNMGFGKGLPDDWSTEILAYQRHDFFLWGGGEFFLIQLLYREIPGSPCFHHFYILNYVNSLWMKPHTCFFFESMGLKTSSKRNRAPCFMKWWGCRPPGVCIHNLKRYLKNGPSFEPLVAPGCFWKKLIFKCGQVLLQRIDTKWPCDP